MKQKTRKPKLANQTASATLNDIAVAVTRTVKSRTSEVDYKQKYEQQKEEIQRLNNELASSSGWCKAEIHRLNSQVGGYKKNLNDSKDTINALNADVNELKTTNLTARQARQSLIRKCEANDIFIAKLQTELEIEAHKRINLTTELKSIKSKWWYKLFN